MKRVISDSIPILFRIYLTKYKNTANIFLFQKTGE